MCDLLHSSVKDAFVAVLCSYKSGLLSCVENVQLTKHWTAKRQQFRRPVHTIKRIRGVIRRFCALCVIRQIITKQASTLRSMHLCTVQVIPRLQLLVPIYLGFTLVTVEPGYNAAVEDLRFVFDF